MNDLETKKKIKYRRAAFNGTNGIFMEYMLVGLSLQTLFCNKDEECQMVMTEKD